MMKHAKYKFTLKCDWCREEDESAMVFVSSELGEHSITTRDIDVNENTIIQFEVHWLLDQSNGRKSYSKNK